MSRPAGSSTTARALPRLLRGIHWKQGHDRAWGTFQSPCWSELIKILGMLGKIWSQDKALHSARSNPRPNTLKCVRQEDPGSHQTHQCCHRVNHGNCPFVPLTSRKPVQPCTVKTISPPPIRIDAERCFRATGVSILSDGGRRSRTATIDSPRLRLPISAVFRLRYHPASDRGGPERASGQLPG